MSTEYHKINSLFKRDRKTNKVIVGDWAIPELEYLRLNTWEFTEKVDGTNIRVIITEDGVTIGGRTDRAQIPADLYNVLKELFIDNEDALKIKFPGGAVLYGEGYGPKIQKVGGLYRDTPSFVLFDVRVGPYWLARDAVNGIASDLGIDSVPLIEEGTLLDGIEIVQSGFKSTWGDFWAEGLVARPKVPMFSRQGSRVITKIKHKDLFTGDPK